MLGQGPLGEGSLGEPEEFMSGTSLPGEMIVWFTVQAECEIGIKASGVQVDIDQ
jgi:hypothetical protein